LIPYFNFFTVLKTGIVSVSNEWIVIDISKDKGGGYVFMFKVISSEGISVEREANGPD